MQVFGYDIPEELIRQWVWAAPVTLFTFLMWKSPLGKIHKAEGDRRWWTDLLAQNTPVERYRAGMGWLLDRIDARLSGPEKAKGVGPARIAWSAGAATISLVIASFYPVLVYVSQWFAGFPLVLGAVELAPAGDLYPRLIAAGWVAGIALLIALLSRATAIGAWLLNLTFLAAMVVFGSSFAESAAITFTVASAGAFLIVLTMTVAGAHLARIAFDGEPEIGFSVAVQIISVVALASALNGGFEFALSLTGALLVGALLAGTFAGALVSYQLAWFAPIVVSSLLLLAGTSAAISYTWQPAINHRDAAYLFLFLGVFPLFNALADFASLGLTRYLLRKGLSGWTVGEALLDLLGGIAIFAALGVGLISYVHWVVPANGLPLLDLGALFDDLDQRREGMWWLAIMMLSTLLPTALHVSVGMLTILLQYPRWVRRGVIRLLDHGADGVESVAWLGSAAICAMITASLWLPLFLFWKAITANHGWLLDQVIGVFRGYAMLIGAV